MNRRPDSQADTHVQDPGENTRPGRGPGLDRRGFLKALGLGGAATLAGCQRLSVRHVIPYLIPPEEIVPGVPTLYAGTCMACPASCGLLATVREGRPVKLEGLPEHPLSAGGLCALGQAHLRGLYDPQRLRGPRARGDRPLGWDSLDTGVKAAIARSVRDGRSVEVLSPTLPGPTARRAVQEFLQPIGGTLVEVDPLPWRAPAISGAYRRLYGEAIVPAPLYDRVDRLLVFGADPFGTAPDPVGATRAWSRRRKEREGRGAARHIQVEGSLTLTGASADERCSATSRERSALLRALLDRLVSRTDSLPAPSLPPRDSGIEERFGDRLDRWARELLAHRGHSLVESGSGDAEDQLATAWINRILASEGSTLDLERPDLTRRGDPEAAGDMLQRLGDGSVGVVIFLESDPVDQHPDGRLWKEALQQASLEASVALVTRPTATAALCDFVAPVHHGLERWADREPRPGLVSLAQPSIRPLFDTREPYECLLQWAGRPTAWRKYLQESWRGRMGASPGLAWERRWKELVAAGGDLAWAQDPPAPSRRAPRTFSVAPAASMPEPTEPAGPNSGTMDWEVELIQEVGRRDGTHAHIPWLRELPDPLTRVSWIPCARMAPESARRLGLSQGDQVHIEREETRVTLPVRLLPGQHPRILGLPLGYGMHGEEEDGEEARTLALATGAGDPSGIPAKVSKAGSRRPLPLMQDHDRAEGRPIVHQVGSHAESISTPHGGHGDGAHAGAAALWPQHPVTSPHWEMVIDLDACTGCSGCVVACQAENNLAVVGAEEMARHRDMYWLRIDRYFQPGEAGEPPDVLFEPMLCHQCDDAPCETVCPVDATLHSEDGLNMQVYNRCVGTRYCANNCPYKVRRFNWFDNTDLDPLERLVLNPDVVVRDRGVMEKCTFCVQRIQAARIRGKKEGDGVAAWAAEVSTACQQSCPAEAIHFGDATDPNGTVARLKKDPRRFQVLAELGTEPSVTYLAKVRRRGPSDGPGSKSPHPPHGEHV